MFNGVANNKFRQRHDSYMLRTMIYTCEFECNGGIYRPSRSNTKYYKERALGVSIGHQGLIQIITRKERMMLKHET